MGKCSSKPQTAEPEVGSPTKRVLLSGLKAIDPSNSLSYKGSQHTLQSLFVQHHKDGEDMLKNSQLQQDPKPLPNTEVGSKQQQEQENKPNSPKSVLTDLARQEPEKFGTTEKVFLPLEASEPAAAAAKFDSGASKIAQNPTNEDATALSVSAAHLSASDFKIHGVPPVPKEDLHPGHELNLSRSISADDVLHDSRASEAKEPTSTKVQTLDAEAADSNFHAEAAEFGIDRNEQEGGCQNSGKRASESKIDCTPEERVMVGSVEPQVQAETELGDVKEIVEAHKSEARGEEATIKLCEPLVVHHAEYFPKFCLESEKNAPKATEEEPMEGEKVGVQAVEGEEMGFLDRKSIEGDKVAVQDKEDNEHENNGVQGSENPAQEGKNEELPDDQKACIQGTVANVHDEHPGAPDRSHNEEAACVEVAVTMENHENEEVQGGQQSKDERKLPSDDKSIKNYGEMEKKTAIANVLSSHVDSTEAAGEFASMKNIEEVIRCEVKKEVESDRGMPAHEENIIKQTDLGCTEKSASGEQLAFSGTGSGADSKEMVIEKPGPERKATDGVKSLENELYKAVSEEVFDKNPALELSSREDKEAESAVLKHKLLEINSTDKLESSKIEPTIEFEHEKNNPDDIQGKQEESFQLAQNERADVNQLSVELESTHSRQIEKSSNGLD